MIDFYARRCPHVYKVAIALEELGLPYRLHHTRLYLGEHLTAEALERNPLGSVPVIVDEESPDGGPLAVFESGAILIYLAEKAGGLLGGTVAERTAALQWLMFNTASTGPAFAQYAFFLKYAREGNETVLDHARNQVCRQLDLLEARLARSPMIAGAGFSVADAATFPWIQSILRYEIDLAGHPAIARWFDEVRGRPAVQRAIAALAPIDEAEAAFDRESAKMAYAPIQRAS